MCNSNCMCNSMYWFPTGQQCESSSQLALSSHITHSLVLSLKTAMIIVVARLPAAIVIPFTLA